MSGKSGMAVTPTIFADGLVEASVQHGVARLVLGQMQSDGPPAACGQVCVPLTQLQALAKSLAAVVQQVEARIREAETRKTGGEEAPALPASFTFGER